MTSTIFSDKSFSPLFKLAWRRNKPVLMTYSVLMALGIIIDLYVMSQISHNHYATAYLAEEYSQVGLASIIIAQGGAMVITLISALLTFTFLHNKRTADMYGSMPATRQTLYVSHLLGGLAASAAPFVIGSFIVMGLTARTGEYLKYDLMFILLGLLGMISAYLLTAIVAYGCGTSIDALVITIAVNVIYAGTVGEFWVLISQMIPGISMDEIFSSPILTLFAPFAFCFFGDYFYFEGVEQNMSDSSYYSSYPQSTAFVVLLVWMIVFSAAMFFLGLFISRKRKAEVSQNEFAAKWLPAAVKIGGSIVGGMMAGVVAAESAYSGYSNMFVFVFWYIFIGLAAFFILHVILNRGVKGGRFIPSFIAYAAVTVVCLGLVFGFTSGMGLDTYVPKASNVSSVDFGYVKYSDPKNIETITQIHKIITEGIRDEYDYPYYMGSSYNIRNHDYYEPAYTESTMLYETPVETYDEPTSDEIFREKYPFIDTSSFNFVYHKKIGFSTKREYYMYAGQMAYYDFDKMEPLLESLYNSEEYKRSQNETLWNKKPAGDYVIASAPTLTYMCYMPTDAADYDSYPYAEMGVKNLPSDEAFIDGLYDNLQLDILSDENYAKSQVNYRNSYYNDYYGHKYLQLSVKYKRPSDKDYDNGGYYYNVDVYVNIPYSYENTVKYLKENGIAVNSLTMAGEDLTITPLGYIEQNQTALDYYLMFGDTGVKGDFDSCLTSVEGMLMAAAFIKVDGGDIFNNMDKFDEWNDKNGAEFSKKLHAVADALYNKYSSDPSYAPKSDYSNELMEKYGGSGEYFCLEDTIITELDKSAEDIVRELSKK